MAGLVEYPLQGKRFTCSQENEKKLSKTDRFLVCENFFNKWPDACVRVLPGLLFDHCPIALSVLDLKYGPRPFRMYSSWIGRPGFEESVMKAVEGFTSAEPPDVVLTKKFVCIRKSLKIWQDELQEKENEQINLAVGELERLEEEMEDRDLSEQEDWTLAENRKLIKDIEFRRNGDLKQSSRVRFGDPLPIWPDLLCDNLRQLSEEDKDFLISPFSSSKIKEAVVGCHDGKAPGPDGMNFKLIKAFWSLFEDDFWNLFQQFHNDGAFNNGSSSSFITLVPKIKDPVSLSNFRPINLVGVVSKVVSKALANRMRKVLSKVISDSQSAFIREYLTGGYL
ncbi:uncharacterized protein LOC110919611 [Helianthus annuus]|uniref:uncharacterized protein LOC110919611 n=1 Tax=Helianthus annuus TaxID=4232 RepID=UPI000B8FEDF2|nr:uncharacterized protein LOC110919611 [Helianthus annuus]